MSTWIIYLKDTVLFSHMWYQKSINTMDNRIPTCTSTDCTYPKLCDQDVSNAAQNCYTVKNIPGIFEIIL